MQFVLRYLFNFNIVVLELAIKTLLNALVDELLSCWVGVLPLDAVEGVAKRVMLEDVCLPQKFCCFLGDHVI